MNRIEALKKEEFSERIERYLDEWFYDEDVYNYEVKQFLDIK